MPQIQCQVLFQGHSLDVNLGNTFSEQMLPPIPQAMLLGLEIQRYWETVEGICIKNKVPRLWYK